MRDPDRRRSVTGQRRRAQRVLAPSSPVGRRPGRVPRDPAHEYSEQHQPAGEARAEQGRQPTPAQRRRPSVAPVPAGVVVARGRQCLDSGRSRTAYVRRRGPPGRPPGSARRSYPIGSPAHRRTRPPPAPRSRQRRPPISGFCSDKRMKSIAPATSECVDLEVQALGLRGVGSDPVERGRAAGMNRRQRAVVALAHCVEHRDDSAPRTSPTITRSGFCRRSGAPDPGHTDPAAPFRVRQHHLHSTTFGCSSGWRRNPNSRASRQ